VACLRCRRLRLRHQGFFEGCETGSAQFDERFQRAKKKFFNKYEPAAATPASNLFIIIIIIIIITHGACTGVYHYNYSHSYQQYQQPAR